MGAGESRSWAGLVSKIQTIDGLRHSGRKSEHGQRMIRVLKTIFTSRLLLARPGGSIQFVHSKLKSGRGRAEHVVTWIGHTDEVLTGRGAHFEKRRRADAAKSYSQWLETAMDNKQILRTAQQPKLSLQHIPWATATASHRNRASHSTKCNHQDKKHFLPRHVIEQRNQCAILLASTNGHRARDVDGQTPGEKLRLVT